MFACLCSVDVLFIGKLKSVHAKWMADNTVENDKAEAVPDEVPDSANGSGG